MSSPDKQAPAGAGPVRRIVIVGGGTAGWMTAAPLAQRLARHPDQPCEVILVESAEIGTIGVGEATLPTIRVYNASLGLDANDFIAKTSASYKLGIEFKDWGHLGNRFFHGFGDYGPALAGVGAHHHWLRLAQAFEQMPDIAHWSVPSVMAREGKFVPPDEETPGVADAYSYGFHFDASLYAAYLRDYAVARGAQRVEGMIVGVEQHPHNGFVTAVRLADGRRVEGDLFIDCSGFRGLLIEGALQAGYEDWSNYLPCNSAQAVPCASAPHLTPFTRSTATGAGWLWRIPLQHRTGNGHVYSSDFITDEQAGRVLLDGLDGAALDAPRQIRFVTGRRRKSWVNNVVAIGLSAGFVEPLESTSINLIETAVGKLLELFPDRDCSPALADEFNRVMGSRYEAVRDFIVLHYKLTARDDTPFWRHCAQMAIPDTLAHQIALFRETGRVAILDRDGFAEPSFVAMMVGLGVMPKRHDPLADRVDLRVVHGHFAQLRDMIAQAVARMPSHGAYVTQQAAAGGLARAAA
ncbi:tryptophan halogenase [Duganella sp. Leaf126]|uniref:tryptophan halogenase family protein n=1 Tax=Duganella sp. Leaf126 TaxID=1736266 RepID=UPI0006F46D4F|nr:tryptophan halogenase family protein [Duganella sp. Leaf126]KQQ45770.1 tryptophan halogenase [Duganella sp. Leaf126]